MASGALPKRVTCPLCKAPEGIPCRDPETFKPTTVHTERMEAAEAWYLRPSPDGLTPKRRDEMVEDLRDSLGKGKVGPAMDKITKAADPEAEFRRLVG